MSDVISGILGAIIGSFATVCFSAYFMKPRVSLRMHLPDGISGAGKVILEVKNIGTRCITNCEITGQIFCNLNNQDCFLFKNHESQTLRVNHWIAPNESLSFVCDVVAGELTTHNGTKRLVKLEAVYKDDFMWTRAIQDTYEFIVDYYMNDYAKNAILYDINTTNVIR